MRMQIFLNFTLMRIPFHKSPGIRRFRRSLCRATKQVFDDEIHGGNHRENDQGAKYNPKPQSEGTRFGMELLGDVTIKPIVELQTY